MALHGEIKINNRSILYWEAIRRGEVEDGVFHYDTLVDIPADEVVINGHVIHRYADGAIVLANKVLTGALNEMARSNLVSVMVPKEA